jgi:hypothetical protein
MAESRIKATANQSLLTRLQAGASRVSIPAREEHSDSHSPIPENAPQTAGTQGGQGYRPSEQIESSLAYLRPRKQVTRSTVSMPAHVADRARRLCQALTILEARDVALGETFLHALDLLEDVLRKKGAVIPEHFAKKVAKPRHRLL